MAEKRFRYMSDREIYEWGLKDDHTDLDKYLKYLGSLDETAQECQTRIAIYAAVKGHHIRFADHLILDGNPFRRLDYISYAMAGIWASFTMNSTEKLELIYHFLAKYMAEIDPNHEPDLTRLINVLWQSSDGIGIIMNKLLPILRTWPGGIPNHFWSVLANAACSREDIRTMILAKENGGLLDDMKSAYQTANIEIINLAKTMVENYEGMLVGACLSGVPDIIVLALNQEKDMDDEVMNEAMSVLNNNTPMPVFVQNLTILAQATQSSGVVDVDTFWAMATLVCNNPMQLDYICNQFPEVELGAAFDIYCDNRRMEMIQFILHKARGRISSLMLIEIRFWAIKAIKHGNLQLLKAIMENLDTITRANLINEFPVEIAEELKQPRSSDLLEDLRNGDLSDYRPDYNGVKEYLNLLRFKSAYLDEDDFEKAWSVEPKAKHNADMEAVWQEIQENEDDAWKAHITWVWNEIEQERENADFYEAPVVMEETKNPNLPNNAHISDFIPLPQVHRTRNSPPHVTNSEEDRRLANLAFVNERLGRRTPTTEEKTLTTTSSRNHETDIERQIHGRTHLQREDIFGQHVTTPHIRQIRQRAKL
jgi:hypothetical protein